ncbi:4993_t:CDS:2, partial [Racocetra fulgida]
DDVYNDERESGKIESTSINEWFSKDIEDDKLNKRTNFKISKNREPDDNIYLKVDNSENDDDGKTNFRCKDIRK